MKIKGAISILLSIIISIGVVFATKYSDWNIVSSGGTGGTMTVNDYVYKTYVSYSGHTVYTFGVHGNIINGSGMVTNWQGWGYLSKGPNEKTIPSSTVYNQNSHDVSLTTETSYTSYNMYMTSSSTAYGSTSYHSYGSF